jgi:hypothetical protein
MNTGADKSVCTTEDRKTLHLYNVYYPPLAEKNAESQQYWCRFAIPNVFPPFPQKV